MVSTLESKLRTLFDVPDSDIPPEKRIQHLGAFWPHWNLHKRKCDKTGKEIISVFRPECPYPVWHKDEWYKHANPPKAVFDFSEPFFPQAEKFFKQCPIVHITGAQNENCEFTDDWWFSRDCYLCHSGYQDEECSYEYRSVRMKNSQFGAFSFESEHCIDLINSSHCFGIVYGLYLKNCRDSAFCYDCRHCTDCLFCFNLRNKSYCLGNKQLSKEEYERQKKQFEYASVSGYQKCQQLFQKMMRDIAWHKSLYHDMAENCSGNYIGNASDCENIFFLLDCKNCFNVVRGSENIHTILDALGIPMGDAICHSVLVQLNCSNVRMSYQLTESRFVDYSAYSAQLENCFGCCGLVRAKNCVMNASYSAQEYSSLKQKMIDHMKSTGEWGQFFPGSFAPNPYDESWSSFYFLLSESEQREQGYFHLPNPEKHNASYLTIDQLPQTPQEANEETTKKTFWDDVAQKPFQILPQDINLCRELKVALPHSHYMRRIQENFRWMPYNGTLRTTKCAKSGKEIQTSWPAEYDGRIVSEEEYLKIVG